jgi:hypothetical protein
VPQNHFEYYLAIESDLEKCARFVDFSLDNYKTHSLEFARIIMAASAEVDAIAKEFCKAIDLQSNANNILGYASKIIPAHPNIVNVEMAAPRFNVKCRPWSTWSENESPSWWRTNNNIKHDRGNNFKEANLENAIAAVSGLLSIILYFHKQSNAKPLGISVFDGAKLFCVTDTNQDDDWESGGMFWSYSLP